MRKEDILIKRGFTAENIRNDLTDITDADWCINTIQKAEVINADPSDPGIMDALEEKLFTWDSVDYGMVGASGNEPFSAFMHCNDFSSPAASVLEPYIARLVHALNGIGVRTYSSCDGWHKTHGIQDKCRRMVIWMPERYSVLWMWLIMEYVFGEKWNRSDPFKISGWTGIWEPEYEDYLFSTNNRESRMVCRFPYDFRKNAYNKRIIYEKNDGYARHIEENTDRLLSVREKMVRELRKYSEEEIERMGFLELRRIMYSYIGTDLEGIAL